MAQPLNNVHRETTRTVDGVVWSADGLHAEKSRCWGLISAAVINRPGREAISLSNYHRVAVSLTAIEGLVSIDGGSAKSAQFLPSEISFTPGGVSTRTILPAARLIQTLQSPATYDDIISEMVRGGVAHFETRYPINDPLASQIVSTLADELQGDFLDNILVDALNTALAVRMVRHFTDPSNIALSCPPFQVAGARICGSVGSSRSRLCRVRQEARSSSRRLIIL